MIPVPSSILAVLLERFKAPTAEKFGGGREDSDGVVYAYPYGAGRRLLKILAFPVEEQQKAIFCFEERLRFMRFLGENGAPVVYPLLSPQGNLYETCASETHGWVGYSMEIAAGESKPFDYWDEDAFRHWGQTVGKMHRLAQQYPSWEASLNPADGKACLHWREEWDGFYHWCQDAEVRAKWVEIRERLEALPRTRQDFGFIHNDPHIANLMIGGGGQVTMLDFDVANHHWFITDLSIACQSILFTRAGGMERPLQDRAPLLRFFECFLAGYATENHLADFWLEQLDLFIAYRRILLFIAMYGWISSQPEQHAAWKQMILTQPEGIGKELR